MLHNGEILCSKIKLFFSVSKTYNLPGHLTLVLSCGDEEGAAGELLSVNNVGESKILTSDLFLTAAFGKVIIIIIII